MQIKNLLGHMLFCFTAVILPAACWSQNKFEIFEVNQKVGIVEVESLGEFLEPTIDRRDYIRFSSGYLLVRKAQDSIAVFEKPTGLWWSKSIVKHSGSLLLRLGDESYLKTKLGSRSALLDSALNPKYFLDKLYENVTESRYAVNTIIGQNNDSVDIYVLKNGGIDLVQSTFGYRHSNEIITTDSIDKEVIVFYGSDKTYVYDLEFNLLDTKHQKIRDAYEIDELLNPNVQRYFSFHSGNSEHSSDKVFPKRYQRDGQEGNHYTSDSSKIRVTLADSYVLKSENSKDFTAFKVFSTSAGSGQTSMRYSFENSFKFIIDESTLKALIPVKYQHEIELEITTK